MSEQIDQLAVVLMPLCHPQMSRDAAVAAIMTIKAQLEVAADKQRFGSDRDGLFMGAEELGSWLG